MVNFSAFILDHFSTFVDIYLRAFRRVFPGERVHAELWMLRSGRVLEI